MQLAYNTNDNIFKNVLLKVLDIKPVLSQKLEHISKIERKSPKDSISERFDNINIGYLITKALRYDNDLRLQKNDCVITQTEMK